MSDIITIANGVKTLLAEYDAEVVYAPEFDLRKMQEMRVAVLPVGKERKFITRSAYENGDSIDVAVIHKCREEGLIPSLVSLVETIGESLLGAKIGTSLCDTAKWEPLFSVDELRTKGLFISIIQLHFKGMGA